MMKRNNGFTLVELIVVILVGSIVTLAATTVMFLGLRINRETSDVSNQQYTANIMLTTLGELAAEKAYEKSDIAGGWCIADESGNPLFSYADSNMYLGDSSGTSVMSNVEATAKLDGNLLTLTVTTDDAEYSTTVYCRMIDAEESEETTDPVIPALPMTFTEVTPDAASAMSRTITAGTTYSSSDLSEVDNSEGREAFLEILLSEEGSTGYSLTTGENFSEWYIGGYETNPSWNEETPWCACFLSWALDQCEEYLKEVPKFAHVDQFQNSFSKVRWKSRNPDPGDVIFFDWEDNGVTYPQHVGVVVKAADGIVYTIEGNTNGLVAQRQYTAEDPRIIGYGVLNWK